MGRFGVEGGFGPGGGVSSATTADCTTAGVSGSGGGASAQCAASGARTRTRTAGTRRRVRLATAGSLPAALHQFAGQGGAESAVVGLPLICGNWTVDPVPAPGDTA